MTDDKIALRALLEKSTDAGMLREMIGFAAERLMALDSRDAVWRRSRRAQHRADQSA